MGNWRIPGILEDIDGRIHLDKVDTITLADEYGTPLFVFSETRIRQNCAEIKQAFQQWGFKTRVFYASKANSNLSVLKIIRDAGLDVEVNSGGELFKALRVGFTPDQVIFNGVAKTEEELREAITSGVYCINVDSVFELGRIQTIAGELNARANIALRIVPGVETGAHGGLETGTHASKFGISENEILEAYRQAIGDPVRLNLLGLHSHIGAQTVDTEKFRAGFVSLLTTAAQCYAESGRKFQTLNMGGGLPVPFIKPGDNIAGMQSLAGQKHSLSDPEVMLPAVPSPADVARETVGRLADGYFDSMLEAISPGFRQTLENTQFLVEPGSRVVADSAVLLTRIQNYKKRPDPNGEWLLLDAGFNILLDTFAYNWYYNVEVAKRVGEQSKALYKLGGPLCDSGDTYHDSEALGRLPDYYVLPEKMTPGDLLVIFDVGAYTLEQMCQYNGQRRAAALLVRSGGNVRLIRQRDSYQDLINQDVQIFES